MTILALSTVADDSFVAGTIVLLHSFAKQHPSITYDIIVFDGGLSNENQNLLSLFPRLTLSPIPGELDANIRQLAGRFQGGKIKQFYSLSLFSLSGYQKVLFCDSDLLYLRSIDDILSRDPPFFACADYCNYRGLAYDETTFEIIERGSSPPCLDTSFNAGWMYIDQSLLSPENYQKALACLSASFWEKIRSPHTDQVIFNHIFKAYRSRLPVSYNYLLNRRPQLQGMTGVLPAHARVLHFNGPKPWHFDRARERMMADPLMVPLYRIWQDAYAEAMQYLTFKQRTIRE